MKRIKKALEDHPERVIVHVGCLISERNISDLPGPTQKIKQDWAIQKKEFQRPNKWMKAIRFPCPVCQGDLKIRVWSKSLEKTARYSMALLTLAGSGLMLGIVINKKILRFKILPIFIASILIWILVEFIYVLLRRPDIYSDMFTRLSAKAPGHQLFSEDDFRKALLKTHHGS